VGISFILPSPSLWTSKNEKFRGSFSPKKPTLHASFPQKEKNAKNRKSFFHPSLRGKKFKK